MSTVDAAGLTEVCNAGKAAGTGGLLMGVGGVTALGCTIGQGLSGVSTLSLTSLVALTSMGGAAYGTVKLQIWQLERASEVGGATVLSRGRT